MSDYPTNRDLATYSQINRIQKLFADNPGVGPLMTTSAFVGTNPTGELITSGFPVIRKQSLRVAGLATYPVRDFTAQ